MNIEVQPIAEDQLWMPDERELWIPPEYRIAEDDKVFGTDGIRAEFGQSPMDRYNVPQIGLVLALALGYGGRAVVCNDGRFSGEDMTEWIAFGMRQAGMDVEDAGVMSTAGVALASTLEGVDFGVSLSASHNPAKDTGVKVFLRGRKLTDEQQATLAAAMRQGVRPPSSMPVGGLTSTGRYRDDYKRFLINSADGERFDGQRLALDTASGAGYELAEVMTELGFDVDQIDPRPNGYNINNGYGVEHLGTLKQHVVRNGYEEGEAKDGDEDRDKHVGRKGKEIDGDYVMLAIAAAAGIGGLVVTDMTNLGVQHAMEASSLAGRPKQAAHVVRAGVGDRQVLARMEALGYVLGGEQSGHVIMLDRFMTGSGVLTSIQYHRALRKLGIDSSELYESVERVPQQMINITCAPNQGTEFDRDMDAFALEAAAACGGLVSVRRSGTQPMVRVTVQSNNAEVDAERIAEQVSGRLGAQVAA